MNYVPLKIPYTQVSIHGKYESFIILTKFIKMSFYPTNKLYNSLSESKKSYWEDSKNTSTNQLVLRHKRNRF